VTPDERRALLARMVDAHDAAFAAMRTAGARAAAATIATQEMTQHIVEIAHNLTTVADETRAMIGAHNDAIDAALRANRAALELLNKETGQ
jgi:hypothetical protein